LPAANLPIPGFDEYRQRYNIIELNTSVKPSIFKYFINTQEKVEKIFYFDPDIKVFAGLGSLESYLDEHEILLTPHIHKPIELDSLMPQETTFLKYGIFNLGFIGLRPGSANCQKFLDWWEQRCIERCFFRLQDGLFVDQLWINFAPYLFENVHCLKEFGYNMGPWNVHERRIVESDLDGFRLNDGSRLVLYHFSGYRFNKPRKLSRDPYNRETLQDRADLFKLYSDYQKELLMNQVEKFSRFDCQLVSQSNS